MRGLRQLHFNLFGFGVEGDDLECADLALGQGFGFGFGGGGIALPAGFEQRGEAGQVGPGLGLGFGLCFGLGGWGSGGESGVAGGADAFA